MTKLSVIIVVYNHRQYLSACLSSLKQNVGVLKPEVIVVDNNSTDGSVEVIKKEFGNLVKLILNRTNLGFAKACNQGLKKARGKYVLLLNPDTQIIGKAIEKMVSFLDKNRQIDCLVPCLLNPDGSQQLSVRNFPGITTVMAKRTPLKILPFFKKAKSFHLEKSLPTQPVIINWALGSCLLTRRQIFEKIGFFDEHFFLYCEEIDWFYRLKKAGLKLYYFPAAKVMHFHLAQSDKYLFSKESFYHFKSIVYFLKKYFWEILSGKYPGE